LTLKDSLTNLKSAN